MLPLLQQQVDIRPRAFDWHAMLGRQAGRQSRRPLRLTQAVPDDPRRGVEDEHLVAIGPGDHQTVVERFAEGIGCG